MAIHDWPEDCRPRERLIKNGAQTLTNPELLAVFLRTGFKGKNAIELGQEMVGHFGSLNRLFNAKLTSFSAIQGMGPAKFAQLQAVMELARRAISEQFEDGVSLHSTTAVKTFLQMLLAPKPYESFTIIYLDVRNRVITVEELFRGTLTQTGVYPREVVKSALGHNAASVFLAHNHPGGDTTPSGSDFAITKSLKQSLELLDIKVLDHFIVAGSLIHSFAEHGQL
jgi:DNA repair protein RadC